MLGSFCEMWARKGKKTSASWESMPPTSPPRNSRSYQRGYKNPSIVPSYHPLLRPHFLWGGWKLGGAPWNPWINYSMTAVSVHPGRLTWNLKMMVWKMMFLFNWVVFRFHVNLPGCIGFIRCASPEPSFCWKRPPRLPITGEEFRQVINAKGQRQTWRPRVPGWKFSRKPHGMFLEVKNLRLFQHTELEHTPSNLYQQAISRDSFHNWQRGIARGVL